MLRWWNFWKGVCDFRIAQWINNPPKFESRNLKYDWMISKVADLLVQGSPMTFSFFRSPISIKAIQHSLSIIKRLSRNQNHLRRLGEVVICPEILKPTWTRAETYVSSDRKAQQIKRMKCAEMKEKRPSWYGSDWMWNSRWCRKPSRLPPFWNLNGWFQSLLRMKSSWTHSEVNAHVCSCNQWHIK